MKKIYRVKKNEEIEKILNNKNHSSNSCFIIYSIKTNETNHFRYAVSVSKKLGNAVVRNHLKRQVRALIRQFEIVDGVDFFIIVRAKTLKLNFNSLKNEMNYLLQKQKLLRKGEKND